ncbi:MAG: hypothetical protein IT371_10020 [Deltaproteobacteria bacterium]|nr:hypothetical protein [Deltaproteobacteria bacterium]
MKGTKEVRSFEGSCPRCGYTNREEAQAQREQRAIRRAIAKGMREAGLKLTPTSFPPSVAARKMGITVAELGLLLRRGSVRASSLDGRLRVTDSEVRRYREDQLGLPMARRWRFPAAAGARERARVLKRAAAGLGALP